MWKKLFESRILERGRRYYYDNAVDIITCKGDAVDGIVYGQRMYGLHIKLKSGKVTEMTCSCPYAREGNNCKHMAAFMYEISEKYPNLLIDETRGIQLTEKGTPAEGKGTDGDIHYFDISKIAAKYITDEKKLAEAKKYLEKQCVTLNSVGLGYDMYGGGMPALRVKGSFINRGARTLKSFKIGALESSELELLVRRDDLSDAKCWVHGCNSYAGYYFSSKRNLCPHIIALMILTEDYVVKNNPGDATDYDGDLYLKKMRNRMRLSGDGLSLDDFDRKKCVSIEPRLERNGDELKLSFKIGDEKKYIVKNLTEMVELYDAGQKLPLGSKNFLDFSEKALRQEDEGIFNFIRDICKQEKMRNASEQYSSRNMTVFESIRSTLLLYGKRLDDFFELCEGRHLEYNDKSNMVKKSEIKLVERSCKAEVKIEPLLSKGKKLQGVNVEIDSPQILYGIDGRYFIDEVSAEPERYELCKIDAEHARRLDMIKPPRMNNMGMPDYLTIGKNYLSEFYYRTLPFLIKYADVHIEGEESILECLPPDVSFEFYIDLDDRHISCLVKVKYGGEEADINHRDVRLQSGFARDAVRESEVLSVVKGLFPTDGKLSGEFLCPADADSVYEMHLHGVDKLLALGAVHCTPRFKSISVKKTAHFSVGVSVESDLLNLDISSDDFSRDELMEILSSYREKKKYHRLRSGDYLSLDDENLETISQLFEDLNISLKDFVSGKMNIPAYRALYLDKVLEDGENLYLQRDQNFKNIAKSFKTVSDGDFAVPETLQKVLRPYQKMGYRWLKTLETYGFGGILADEMGLGKTLQVISSLQAETDGGRSVKALIVSPASLIYNWEAEFAKFAPSISATVVAGKKSERSSLIKAAALDDSAPQSTQVFITSYDLLKRDIDEYEDISFDYAILDEAQYIKNHGTTAAKSVKAVKAKNKLALTGTPIENRLSELWSIFDFLMPGFLYKYEAFKKYFETPIAKHGDSDAAQRLKKMVSPFILRRLKTDVLKDLPEKSEEISYAKFEGEQQKLYDGQVLHMKELLEAQRADEFNKNKIKILAEITRLRQICCDPSLIFEDYASESAKREACLGLIESAIDGGHRILLFSQFTSMLELLEKDLAERGIEYYKITGETPKSQRMELVNRFNDGNVPVFVISLKAGGTGLNLTGADIVIHYDPWWNVAAQNQATDRAHRIGQKRSVTVYKLIAKGTIEEKILELQAKKRDMAESVLSGESGGLASLSREELLELLSV